jgi:hypothetical protein
MASSSSARRIVFTGKQQVQLESFSAVEPGLGEMWSA